MQKNIKVFQIEVMISGGDWSGNGGMCTQNMNVTKKKVIQI